MPDFQSVVVLTGAGISAESGLKTFRDNDGLWEGHPVEQVATPEAFATNPQMVQKFYNARRKQLCGGEVHPNTAHTALAVFESAFVGDFILVTQNVDNLHQRAGSQNVLPMHGELTKARCLACDAILEWLQDIEINSVCSQCGKGDSLRPHIVWFGEIPLYMDEIERALAQCDLFVSIGTSGVVYPAAGFQQLAKYAGAKTVELNLEPGNTASQFDEVIYGHATQVVPDFFQRLAPEYNFLTEA